MPQYNPIVLTIQIRFCLLCARGCHLTIRRLQQGTPRDEEQHTDKNPCTLQQDKTYRTSTSTSLMHACMSEHRLDNQTGKRAEAAHWTPHCGGVGGAGGAGMTATGGTFAPAVTLVTGAGGVGVVVAGGLAT